MSGYGVAYLSVGLFCGLMVLVGFQTGGWFGTAIAVTYGWACVGCMIPAVAYLGGQAHWFGKGSDGTLRPVARIALWSFHVINYASYLILRFGRGERVWDEVTPVVWVGRRPRELESAAFAALAPASVLDLTAEHPAWADREVEYKNIAIVDGAAPTMTQFESSMAFLDHAPRPVLVHCALGHGRSATIVAAWMVRVGRASSVEEAEQMMRLQRPWVRIRRRQRRAAQAFIGQGSSVDL